MADQNVEIQEEMDLEQLEQRMEDHVITDIEAITNISDEGLLSPRLCIYKVPPALRDMNKDAYTPKVISIGPFHHGNEGLQEMERHKQIMFKRFTREARTSLDGLVNFVKEKEPDVRASYSENITLNHTDFVKLILLDAVFIIQLFVGLHGQWVITNDAKLSNLRLRSDIKKDLVLLENQLPFFFLEDLFNMLFPRNRRGNLPSFLEQTYAFFDIYNIQDLESNPNVRIKHFTDLLRLYHQPITRPSRQPFLANGDYELLYSAKELEESGVKLKASQSKCLLDLKFSGHTLEVPHISVEDTTEFLFRNMIAFEQCHYPSEHYIADYAALLDQIINTEKDVEILIHSKIVSNNVGDASDVAKIFNRLVKEVDIGDLNSHYVDICKKLNDFYQDRWHKGKATLRRDYCNTPWRTVASIAAIVLLILTIIQTIFSILQVTLKQK